MPVAVVMLVGAKEEPFLSACLECLNENVDRVIVNDNSGLYSHPNLDNIKNSKLYSAGRIEIVSSAFLGFGACRDLCLDVLRRAEAIDTWVFIVDSDEIHPPQELRAVTRDILPNLPPEVGIVDGYFYDFFQSPHYFQNFNHRHNLFFRFHPDIHWTHSVHEHLQNLRGQRLVLPYRSFHYGYLKDVASIRDKWQMYGELGDPISGAQALDVAGTVERVSGMVWRFFGAHPQAVHAALTDIRAQNEAAMDAFCAKVSAQPFSAIRSHVRNLHIGWKMRFLAWKAAARFIKNGPVRKGIAALR